MLTPAEENGGGGGGLGNLADELDQLDDDQEEYEEEGDVTEDALDNADRLNAEQETLEHIRDSGVDVSYNNANGSKKSSPRHVRNFSKPFAESEEKPPDEKDEDNLLTPELEDCISAVYRMAQYADATEDPLIPRAIAQMQDLGNQTTLEAAAQRLNTSTNSMSSHLGKETRALQTLSASLYSPFMITGLDAEALDQAVPMIESLLQDLPLPQPDEDTLKGLQKLGYETERTIGTLSQLTDTLQMGKQTTNTAARHLRTTQTMVEELRRERERAESAREDLAKSGFEGRIRERWCKSECEDVVSGFESLCRDLRKSLEGSVQAAA